MCYGDNDTADRSDCLINCLLPQKQHEHMQITHKIIKIQYKEVEIECPQQTNSV